MLTKTDMLLIRACKSNNKKQRIYSVYSHFYGCSRINTKEETVDVNLSLILILSEIIEDYYPIKLINLLNFTLSLEKDDVETKFSNSIKTLDFLIAHIRFSKRSAWKDLISPKKFR